MSLERLRFDLKGATDADDVLSYLKDLSMEYKRLAAANPNAVFVAKKQKAYEEAAAYLKKAVDTIQKCLMVPAMEI